MTALIVLGSAYLLSAFLILFATLLAAYGVLQVLPGPSGNSLRRVLFGACRPILSWVGHVAPVHVASCDLTAFLAAIVLLVLFRFGVPWLFLLGHTLHG
jgi:uncharacterized protein YggT (Ycf19 family)